MFHADGELEWSQRFERTVQATQVRPDGDLVTALVDRPVAEEPVPEDEVADVHDPPDRPPDVTLVRLDRRDGTERWRVG